VPVLMRTQDNLTSVIGLDLVGKRTQKRIFDNLLPPLLVLLADGVVVGMAETNYSN
jgi:hypothetical protein